MTTEWYQICIKGHLDEHWSIWFDGMDIVNEFDADQEPITLITGPVVDQAALYGMLCRLRDLGVQLISVRPHPDPDVETQDDEESDNHTS